MKKHIILLLTISLILTASTTARTQTNFDEQSVTDQSPKDWQRMYGIKEGTKLVVELKNGQKGEGKFLSLLGTRLTLFARGHTYVFEQSGIQRVYGFKGGSRSKSARIGAGIGMVIGTVISVRNAVRAEREPGRVSSSSDGTPSFGGLLVGGVAGAGVGALFGTSARKELLYEAK